MKSMKRFSVVAAFAVFATLLPAGAGLPSASALACSGGRAIAKDVLRNGNSMEQVQLKTLKLEASPVKKTYEIGDVAKFKALVTRPADEDPLGQGIPMDRPYVTPAEGISIGVGLLFNGNVFLPGFAITDANGEAVIKVKIMSYVKPGTVHGSFFAWKTMLDLPCARIDETGYLPMPDVITVKKDLVH